MGRNRGFSLVELLIVMAIIAILAAIAYPSYQSYIVSSNRAAAQQFLLNAANRQEQYMLDRRQYANGTDTEILNDLGMSVPDDVDNVYAISFNVTASPPSFEITASPKAGTIQDGDGDMVLDSDGTKTPAEHWN